MEDKEEHEEPEDAKDEEDGQEENDVDAEDGNDYRKVIEPNSDWFKFQCTLISDC